MKPLKKIFIISVCIFSYFFTNAQLTTFFYYQGEKFYLDIDFSSLSVVSDEKISLNKIKNRVNEIDFDIKNQQKCFTVQNLISNDKENTGKFITEIVFPGKLEKAVYLSNIQNLQDELGVVKVSPTYILKNKKLGISNNFYVKLNRNDDVHILYDMAEKYSMQVLGYNEFMPLWYTLACTKDTPYNAIEASNLFFESHLFESTGPEFLYYDLGASTDPFFGSQWGLKNTGQYGGTPYIDIDATSAWNITTGSPNVRVAIFDHGFEMNHTDLLNNIYGLGYDATTGNSPSILRGPHGTACAGIVGAQKNNLVGISGVAPSTGLMSISINLTYFDTPQQLANGFNWAWQNGADVISNSWGGYAPSPIIDYAISNALINGRNGKGTVIVFASGNYNNQDILYPGNSHPDILVVGAISPCGERKSFTSCDGEGWGSSYGDQLDVMAPGVLIPTTDIQGLAGYNPNIPIHILNGGSKLTNDLYDKDYTIWFNGTSSACPHVAGVAALVLSVNPELTVQEVNDIIESTARKVGGYNYDSNPSRPNGTWHIQMGYGLVDAFAAVLETQKTLPIVIYDNEIWYHPISIYSELIIKPNATLDIRNTIKLSKNAKIIIEKGGKLIVNGGTLTNLDNHFWQGIYIEGDRTKTQTFANQGALILQNNAVIENARDAVQVRGVADNWWGNGGIIRATNTTFRNNWRNVSFNSYEHPSISWFTDCTFETDNQTIHNEHTSNVSIWNMQGITFTNCTFKDTRTNIDYNTEGKSRYGVYTIDGSFMVDNCSFDGMKYGIYAITDDLIRTFKVYDSQFSSFKGIYFSHMDNVHVVNNTFFVKPGYMYGIENQETYGLYLENSQNFEITENTFTSTGISAPCNCNSYGAIVRNAGSLHQEIYRNDFDGFKVGINAIGNNKGGTSQFEGLEIRCNRFYNTHNDDILVAKDLQLPPSAIQGIKVNQGLIYMPSNHQLAGNIFTNNKWYRNNADNIWYFHHKVTSHPNLKPTYFTSGKISFSQQNYDYVYETSCPVRQISRSTQMLLTEMDEGLTGQKEAELQLLQMTDGGNTGLMLQQVEMTVEPNAYDTYRHMMKTSPWLSEEVLVAVASREEGFTHAMIRDILVANPQSAKSEKVIQALENRKEKLSPYMIAQIESGNEKWGEMELLQQQIAGYKIRYERALNEQIRNHMHNGTKSSQESIDRLLSETDDIRYRYWLAEWAYSWGDHNRGAEILKAIGEELNQQDEWEMYNHQQYLDYYALLSQWTDREEYPGLTGLPETALEAFEKYVNTGHRVSGKALAILLLNEAIDYREPIYYPEEEMVKKSQQAPPPQLVSSGETTDGLKFRVFPNPGRDFITFDWCMEEKLPAGSRIEIYNASGLLLRSVEVTQSCNQTLFSLENLQGGNYVARFIAGSETRNVSFIVSR